MKLESLLLDKLTPNPYWTKLPLFDRKGWKHLPFGEFAESVNERVEPSAAAEEIYVGLDDLDPQDLRIRRWGKGSDVIGTKLRFRKGDLIFGRRRAYQRKLAVAEFDGICSAHAMVVRAKQDMVLPEFLPFLMMSDRFMKRAVEISVGSLSPTINWTTLKHEEFDLPPIDQQRHVTEILCAIEGAIEAFGNERAAADNARECLIFERLQTMASNDCDVVPLAEACERIVDGTHFTPTYVANGVPFLRVTDIQGISIDWNNVKRISPSEHKQLCQRCSPQKGDVLLSKNGTIGITRVVDWEEEFSIFVSLCLLRAKESLLPEYLAEALSSKYVQDQFHKRSKQGTVTNLHLVEIRDCRLPVPSKVLQKDLIQVSSSFFAAITAMEVRRDAMLKLRKEMLETFLA